MCLTALAGPIHSVLARMTDVPLAAKAVDHSPLTLEMEQAEVGH